MFLKEAWYQSSISNSRIISSLPTTRQETIHAVHEIMTDNAFGAAGDTCVVESFSVGPEASCLAFCDGKTAKLMPKAQDHKRALDGDNGLNTGEGDGGVRTGSCCGARYTGVD